MIRKASCLPYPLYLVSCKSVLFFMIFYSAKVVRGMVTFGRSMAKKVFVIC